MKAQSNSNPNLLLWSPGAQAWRPHSNSFANEQEIHKFITNDKRGQNIVLVRGHVDFDGSVKQQTQKEMARILGAGKMPAIITPKNVTALPELVRTKED